MRDKETYTEEVPTIAVHILENGDIKYYVSGEQVRLLLVDERAPIDRVYEYLSRCEPEEISNIIGGSTIGSSQDGRHEAIKHRIENFIEGKSHLSVVDVGEDISE